ncbi:MAG: YbhB/YbcL family Raf kinase inhibitor-like protein [Gammaproteobacteria bacterium]|nr:YbhB/YbcL family Raf kinase inhibitor-like protein [Gammaproteobacteria bacterium]
MIKHLLLATPVVVMSLTVNAQSFEASSADIQPNASIAQKFAFNGFGCTGENLSPEISWKNPPAAAKSFALMVHDPDAPTGGAGFWHWVVVNIPTTSSGLVQGAGTANGRALPAGARQINTDFGVPGWGGPCPPAGDKPHHYNFTIYALSVDKLELSPNTSAALTGFMVNMNAISKASFTGQYGR